MAEDKKDIPSFNEFVYQRTGKTLNPVQNIPSTQGRVPTFEEYLVSKGLGPQPWVSQPQQQLEAESGEFFKGLSRGWTQTKALGHGTGAVLGTLAEQLTNSAAAHDFAQRRVEDYTRLMSEAEESSPEIGSIEEIDSPGKFISWAAAVLGEQIPNIASIVISGGIGGLIGKLAAKQAVKGMSKELVEEQLKKKVSQWIKLPARGALGGTYLGASTLETGGIAGEQIDAGLPLSPGVALAGGGIAGALEFVPFVTVAKRLGLGEAAKGSILKAINDLPIGKRILATSALVSGQEGGTEVAQEVIAIAARTFVDENYDALSPEALSRLLNAGAAGTLVGGVSGGISGVRKNADPDEYAPDVPYVDEETQAESSTVQAEEAETGTAETGIPSWIESPKTPFQETYILDDQGISKPVDTDPAEIVVNSAGHTDSSLRTELDNLVNYINREEEQQKTIWTPDTDVSKSEPPTIYVGREFENYSSTLQRLIRAHDDAVAALAAHGGQAGAANRAATKKRIRALEKQIQAVARREAAPLPPYLQGAENGAQALTKEGINNQPPIITENEQIEAEGPANETIITDNEASDVDLSGLTPAQRERAIRLLEKEEFDGLSEREYDTLERLLAIAQGEKAAERVAAQDREELQQTAREISEQETTRSQLNSDKENLLGMQRSEVQEAAREFLETLSPKKRLGQLRVKVVNSLDLYNTPLADKASRSKGIYQLTRNGRSIIYLIEDNLPNKQAVIRTLLHEVGAHHGLRAFLTPEQKKAFLGLVQRNVDLSGIRARYEANRGNLSEAQFNEMVAEEYVAKIAEDGTNMPLLNRVIGWIKKNLRKWFPNWSKDNVSFSDNDIRYMLRDVHRYLRDRMQGDNPAGTRAHVGRNGRIFQSQAAAQFDNVLSQLNEDEEQKVADAVNNLGNVYGVKFSKLFYTPLQIADKYGIQPVKDYIQAVQRFQATKMGIISKADQLVVKWRVLGDKSAQRVARALFEISEDSDIKEQRFPQEHVQKLLENKYKLTQDEQEIYWQVDQSMQELLDRLENGLKFNAAQESLNADPREFLEAWNQALTLEEKQEVVAQFSPGGVADLTILQRMNEIQQQFDLMRNRNYFPRMRFGPYTVAVRAKKPGVVKGQEVEADELVHFEAFESLKAAARGLRVIKEEFRRDDVYIQESELSDEAFTFMGLPPALRENLAKDLNLSMDQEELLKDVFIKMSPGRSFVKHLRQRRGVEGYSEDAMRTYGSYMMSAANHLARIEHFPDMQRPIAEMREWERTARRYIPNNRSLVELREYFEEHLDYILNPKNDWAKLRALGFLWYLGLNPKSALVNASQVPMVTYPFLASRYGDGRAVSAIVDSYKRVSKSLRGRGPAVLTADEQQMFERLLAEGVLDESLVMELAGIAEAPSLFRILPQQKDTQLINKVSYWGGWMFRHVEKFNRRVSALAAYKLARDNGASFEQAYQAAKESVQTTQYEYAKWNRPKFMRGRKSVIFLFWMYLQQTSYLMAGGKSYQMAMRMWLMTLLSAGMLGLPFAEDILDLIDWSGTQIKEATGMKNPRVDLREDLREILTNITDRPDIFLHGLGRYYGLGPMHILEALGVPVPNIDVSGSLSLGRIVPGVDSATTVSNNPHDKFGRTMMDILGPVGAMGFNLWKAMESSDPDIWKKWERALPVAMKNASRAGRWIARGEETSSTGAALLEFDPYDPEQQAEVIAQLFSFTPTRLGQTYDLALAQNEAKRYWMSRRKVIMHHFGYARMLNDQEGISDARKAVRDFNRTVPDNQLRITGKDLANSLKTRRRIKRNAENQLPDQKRYRQLYEEKIDLYPESK